MKNLILIILIFSFISSTAQIRVLERSGRQPSWVNGLEKDYIIASGTGATLHDAQENALNMIKQRIVTSVAENVRTSSEIRIEEQSVNNKVNLFLENFSSQTQTESAQVPFLKGVSLSKAEDYYWEKTQNRSDNVIRYNYHIKYPFPEFELQKLVMDFSIRDRQLSNELEEALESIDNLTSIEEIKSKIGELRILSDYFMDGRKDRARLGINRLQNILNSVQIVEIESSPGQVKYALKLNNNYIKTTINPRVFSECARITGTQTKQEYTVINYNFDNCYDDPENHILVSYRLGSTTLQNKFYFDIKADVIEIFVNEPIRIMSTERKDDKVSKSTLYLTVISRYETPFKIDRVILDLPGHGPLYLENINAQFQGKGNHSLQINIDEDILIDNTSTVGQRRTVLSGHIHYSSLSGSDSKTHRLFNQDYSTNW